MRARQIVLMICMGALLLGLGNVWFLKRCEWNCITEENAQKIRAGMTYQEVEAIVGLPAGDYASDCYYEVDLLGGRLAVSKRWCGSRGMIEVSFVDGTRTEPGTVWGVTFRKVRYHDPEAPGLLDRVLQALSGQPKEPRKPFVKFY